MKRVTRREIRSWLDPMRSCFRIMKASGEVESIRGYAVTRLNAADEYARIDYCIAGFRALIARLIHDVDLGVMERIERKLSAGVMMTMAEIDAALAALNSCEDLLIKKSRAEIKDAVLTEQICIEVDQAGLSVAKIQQAE